MYIAVVILQCRPFFQRSHLPSALMSTHWTWEFFTTDGLFYRNNHSNKNAWRNACLECHRSMLRASDVVSASLCDTGPGQPRTEVESVVPIYSNITRTLKPLISRTICSQSISHGDYSQSRTQSDCSHDKPGEESRAVIRQAMPTMA